MVRPADPDYTRLADAAELLRALGTPHRLAIVLELAVQPRCVHELVELVGVSQSLASQHLRVLRTLGLVTGTRHGRETLYALADDHVAHIARDAVAHGSEPDRPSRSTPQLTELTELTELSELTELTTEEHQR